jgi:o-succinylbenzoate synthase
VEAAIRSFSVSLARPFATSTGELTTREGFLVRISDGEHVGYGEATPLAPWTESRSDCEAALEDAVSRLRNEEAALREDLEENPAARHGISLALADFRAKQHGRPLYKLLGRQSERRWLPVNATVGDSAPAGTAAAAERAVEAGYETVKVKVGARPVDDDVARLRAVRDAVGPDVAVRADANGAWSREQSQRAFDAFAEIGIQYVEQPLDADDIAGHRELRGGRVGVALDESLAMHGVREIVDADAADVLVLKPMALGGVERARRLAVEVAEEGVASVVTTTIDAVVARVGAVHVAASIDGVLPCGVATGDWLSTDLGADPAFVDDGCARVPQDPGLGVHDVWEDDD